MERFNTPRGVQKLHVPVQISTPRRKNTKKLTQSKFFQEEIKLDLDNKETTLPDDDIATLLSPTVMLPKINRVRSKVQPTVPKPELTLVPMKQTSEQIEFLQQSLKNHFVLINLTERQL